MGGRKPSVHRAKNPAFLHAVLAVRIMRHEKHQLAVRRAVRGPGFAGWLARVVVVGRGRGFAAFAGFVARHWPVWSRLRRRTGGCAAGFAGPAGAAGFAGRVSLVAVPGVRAWLCGLSVPGWRVGVAAGFAGWPGSLCGLWACRRAAHASRPGVPAGFAGRVALRALSGCPWSHAVLAAWLARLAHFNGPSGERLAGFAGGPASPAESLTARDDDGIVGLTGRLGDTTTTTHTHTSGVPRVGLKLFFWRFLQWKNVRL